MEASFETEEYLMEMNMPSWNDFENIVQNGTFAHYEQMLLFPQCFQRSSVKEAKKGISYEV